jgi:hypothetical protein
MATESQSLLDGPRGKRLLAVSCADPTEAGHPAPDGGDGPRPTTNLSSASLGI